MTTKIEWADKTWNPIVGCSPVSPGCQNCYAAMMATRLAENPKTPWYKNVAKGGKWTGETGIAPQSVWDAPRLWRKPTRYFVGSMTDMFRERIIDTLASDVLTEIKHCHWHTFMVLTKHPDMMLDIITDEFGMEPIPNLWIGVTAEDQQRANERIPILCQIPAAKRFVNIEPMLGPVDLRQWVYDENFYVSTEPIQRPPKIDWVIVGGETGPNARPMHPSWARSAKEQCQIASVPYFFKQWGEWAQTSDRGTPEKDCLFPFYRFQDGVLMERLQH